MQALQLMIKTYTETPDFGDATKFQEELNTVTKRVCTLEEELTGLNRDLDLVESKMNLNMRHSLLASPGRSLLSINTANSRSSSTISEIWEGLEHGNNEKENDNEKETGVAEAILTTVGSISVDGGDNSEDMNEVNSLNSTSLSDDWNRDCETEYLTLPIQRLMALYSYEGTEKGTLSMDLGDEFEVLGEDTGGWIQVRRAGFIEEGFIPIAYTQSL